MYVTPIMSRTSDSNCEGHDLLATAARPISAVIIELLVAVSPRLAEVTLAVHQLPRNSPSSKCLKSE